MSDWGFVYVASNAYMPGLVKIGMTRGSPSKRLEELSTTSVPGEFELVYAVESCDCAADEALIHSRIASARVHGREFFRCSPKCVIEMIRDEGIGLELEGCSSLWDIGKCDGCAACLGTPNNPFAGI